MRRKKAKQILLALVVGVLNGLFGAGGGVVTVPALEMLGVDPKKAHATSLALILPASLLSATLYLINGSVTFSDVLPCLPAGLLGAGTGALLLKKITVRRLKLLFALLVTAGGVRLLLR